MAFNEFIKLPSFLTMTSTLFMWTNSASGLSCVVEGMEVINCFDVAFTVGIECVEDYFHSLTRRFLMRNSFALSHVYPYCFDIDIVRASNVFSGDNSLLWAPPSSEPIFMGLAVPLPHPTEWPIMSWRLEAETTRSVSHASPTIACLGNLLAASLLELHSV